MVVDAFTRVLSSPGGREGNKNYITIYTSHCCTFLKERYSKSTTLERVNNTHFATVCQALGLYLFHKRWLCKLDTVIVTYASLGRFRAWLCMKPTPPGPGSPQRLLLPTHQHCRYIPPEPLDGSSILGLPTHSNPEASLEARCRGRLAIGEALVPVPAPHCSDLKSTREPSQHQCLQRPFRGWTPMTCICGLEQAENSLLQIWIRVKRFFNSGVVSGG